VTGVVPLRSPKTWVRAGVVTTKAGAGRIGHASGMFSYSLVLALHVRHADLPRNLGAVAALALDVSQSCRDIRVFRFDT